VSGTMSGATMCGVTILVGMMCRVTILVAMMLVATMCPAAT